MQSQKVYEHLAEHGKVSLKDGLIVLSQDMVFGGVSRLTAEMNVELHMLWEVFLEILSGIIQGLNDCTESVVLQYLPLEKLSELDDWKAFWGPDDFTRIMNLHCPLGVYIRAAPPSEFEEPKTVNSLDGGSEGAMNENPPPAVGKVSEVGFLNLYISPCIVNFYI
jgi:hypothetical protein